MARRHIEAVDELTEEEAVELGVLLRQVSVALKEVVGCVKTYVMQFAEAEGHPHVHFHVVPRMADQPEERRSTKIFGYLRMSEAERVSEERMNEIARQVRLILKVRNLLGKSVEGRSSVIFSCSRIVSTR